VNIDQLLRENEKKLYARAFILTRNEADARDLLQITMEKCFKAIEQLDNYERFLPWAYTILRNSFIDLGRSKKGKEFKSLSDLDNFEENSKGFSKNELNELSDKSTPYDNSVIQEKFRFTMQAILELKPIQRDILNLISTGASYDEIAKELDMKKGTVMSTLCRAREIISNMWEKHLLEFSS
tara:strand:- start:713 stop:1258 length:546 start_codon:yes stop_codon:yes gene_type:complete